MWYNKLYLITLELPCLETFLTEGSKECALSEFIHLIGIPRKPVFRLTFLLVHFSFLLQLPCKSSVMNFCWKDLELYILSGVRIPFCFLDFFPPIESTQPIISSILLNWHRTFFLLISYGNTWNWKALKTISQSVQRLLCIPFQTPGPQV